MRRSLFVISVASLVLGVTLAYWAPGLMAQATRAARLAPHAQTNLPPLNIPTYKLPRTPDQIRVIYKFAAEHPEVLGYMPCFCSCEQLGHTSNDECFVKTRAKNGDVTAWQDHGMVCAMCLAVGETAMKMSAEGKSVRAIRAEVERRYASETDFRTPTPAPPKG